MLFRRIYDDNLAQAAYLIGFQKTREAIVIDPERDIDRYLKIAKNEGLKITAIAETHIHADFLSGAREMAERTGAKLYLSNEGGPDWKYQWLDKKYGGGSYEHQLLKDGDTFKIGNIEIKAIHTPGHTPEHLSYFVTDLGGGASEPMGVASGDFVFVGDVGRPDLLETAAGQKGVKESSAKQLYESIQLFKEFPDYMQLWPAHGAGSACGKALRAVPQSTVGYEKKFNTAIADAQEETRFVSAILHGQPEPPLYFARMKKENRDGPKLLGDMPVPEKIEADGIYKILEKRNALLDTRSWKQYIKGHLEGALFTPLDKSFPTIPGSYVEPEQRIYLIVDASRVEEAVTALIRIGLDNVVGYITPDTLASYNENGGVLLKTEFADMTTLKNKTGDQSIQILDVRRADEYESGHLPNAINIAHTRLLAHLNEVPKDKPIMVHCRSGIRSAYATAMLQSHGFNATQMDGGFLAWEKSDGEVVK